MRKFLIITTIVFGIVGILFVILPMGSFALPPILIAVICSIFALIKSEESVKKTPKILFILSVVLLMVAMGEEVFVKDVVLVDQQFSIEKEESKKEAQQELEGLE